jgi:hypothetical protein
MANKPTLVLENTSSDADEQQLDAAIVALLVADSAALPPRARARDDEPVLLAPQVNAVVAGRMRAGPAAALGARHAGERLAPRQKTGQPDQVPCACRPRLHAAIPQLI